MKVNTCIDETCYILLVLYKIYTIHLLFKSFVCEMQPIRSYSKRRGANMIVDELKGCTQGRSV